MRRKKRFRSPYLLNEKRGLWDLFLWRAGFYKEKLPIVEAPAFFSYPRPSRPFNPHLPGALWIGHSTFLLSCAGKTILTDPIWSERCSPVPFYGPKRRHPAPVSIEELPAIDFILISHNHYDHLDAETVKKLNARFPLALWIVPTGLKTWFQKRKIKNVHELFWWEEKVTDNIRITAVPGQHYSGRGLFDRNRSLWAGFVIEFLPENRKVYFAGDTGYNPYDFKSLGQHFGKMDLSLIPIGTYMPHDFMTPVHIDPKEAVQIHQEVNSVLSLGMHWRTFPLSDEPMHQPPYDLYLAMKDASLDPHTFLSMEPGEKVNW